MKKNVFYIGLFSILLLVLITLTINLYGYSIFPNQTIKYFNSRSNLTETYKINTIISISEQQNNNFEDIILQSDEIINETLNDYYNKINISLGKHTYNWEYFYKFNSLTTNNSFENKTIYFEDINNYNMINPISDKLTIGKSITEDFFKMNKKYINKGMLSNINNKSFFNKGYIYNVEIENKDIFKNFINNFSKSNEYKNFFSTSSIIEEKIKFNQYTKEINDLFQNIGELSTLENCNLIYTINENKIQSLEVNFNVIYNKNIKLLIKIIQTYDYNIEEENIDKIIPINSFTKIEDLTPSNIENNKLTIDGIKQDGDIENPISDLDGVISFDNIKINANNEEDKIEIKEELETTYNNINEEELREEVENVVNN